MLRRAGFNCQAVFEFYKYVCHGADEEQLMSAPGNILVQRCHLHKPSY